jgi:hypothetical protein
MRETDLSKESSETINVRSIRIDSDFQLFTGLSVANEVLGQSFEICIAGQKGKILFPLMDKNKDYTCTDIYDGERNGLLRDFSLIQPKLIYKSLLKDWGHIVQWNSLNATITRLAISFEISDSTKLNEFVADILKSFPNYFRRFQLYLEHFHKTSFEEIEVNQFCQDSFTFWKVDPTTKDLESVGMQTSNITVNIATKFLSLELIKAAFAFSSKNDEIRMEHIKIIEARKALRSDNLRLAIIEIAASIEIGLNFVVNEYLKSNNVEVLKQVLVDKKTLGNLIALAKIIGIDLIDSVLMNKLLEDRNQTIHRNIHPKRNVIVSYLNLIYDWNIKNIPLIYK